MVRTARLRAEGRHNGMFIGHFAGGFAGKRYAPRASLARSAVAPLSTAGWETVRVDPGRMKLAPFDFVSYPWSHSLLLCAVWAVLFATIYYWMTQYRPGTVAI